MAKRGARSWLILGILTALILYIAAQLIPVFFRGYQTQTAVTSTLADAVPARGIAVRREQALESAGACAELSCGRWKTRFLRRRGRGGLFRTGTGTELGIEDPVGRPA